MMVFASGIASEECRSVAETATAVHAARRAGLAKCLIVSGNTGLRERLGAVADLSGWEEFDLPETAADLSAAIEGDYRLVVVDVAGPLGDRVNDSVELIEEFAARPGTLLVVCGCADSVDEELWARQIGAWVYLPGVSSGDALVSLFTEARRLSQRRVERRWSAELTKGGL